MPRSIPEILPCARRVRVRLGGEWIVDTAAALLLRENGRPPAYYVPRRDCRAGSLAASNRPREDGSEGRVACLNVHGGERSAEAAARLVVEPAAGVEGLRDHVAFDWSAMDAWYEEDERIYVHPRDPRVRVDALLSSRRVRLEVGGTPVAETHRPVLLFETGLPVRYYIPRLDVRESLLLPGDRVTRCPYKGEARYYSLKAGETLLENVAWCYRHPLPEAGRIADMLCFHDERLEGFRVDGG